MLQHRVYVGDYDGVRHYVLGVYVVREHIRRAVSCGSFYGVLVYIGEKKRTMPYQVNDLLNVTQTPPQQHSYSS